VPQYPLQSPAAGAASSNGGTSGKSGKPPLVDDTAARAPALPDQRDPIVPPRPTHLDLTGLDSGITCGVWRDTAHVISSRTVLHCSSIDIAARDLRRAMKS